MALPEAAVATPLFHSDKKPDPLRELGILSLNGMFDEMDGVSVLKQATEILPDDLAIVSSFGADSIVLLHMVSQVDKNLPVYFLETGKHFPETLAYVETVKQHLGLTNITASAALLSLRNSHQDAGGSAASSSL